MGSITFTGLASGFDSNAVIDSLVAAEKAPITQLTNNKNAASTQLSTIGDLLSKVGAFGLTSLSLTTSTGLDIWSATSSNQGRVTASASASAAAGTYAVKVTQLATVETRVSQTFASDTAGIAGAGSMTIGAATVTWDATKSLTDIAAALNQSGAASASVIENNGSYQLMVSAKSSGTANALVIGGTTLGLDANVTQAAADALFSVNGVSFTRSSNVVNDAVTGLSLTLTGETQVGEAATRLTVTQDRTALQQKVQTLIDGYNAVAKVLNSQLSYNGAKKGTETLFGNSMLLGLQRRMGLTVASTVVGTVSAAQLGIRTAADGTLTFDAAKLNAALDKDPSALKTLFTGATGLAQTLQTLTKEYSDPLTGQLISAQKARERQIAGYDKEITRINLHATQIGESLRMQFAKLDQMMAQFKSAGDYLTALSKGSGS